MPRLHNIKGADFWKWIEKDREKAHRYLEDDVEETYQIADRVINGK
jgi:hypothetical protein